jgi:hypothetical protein
MDRIEKLMTELRTSIRELKPTPERSLAEDSFETTAMWLDQYRQQEERLKELS